MNCLACAAPLHVIDVSVTLGILQVAIVNALQSPEPQLAIDPLRLWRRQCGEVMQAASLDRHMQRLRYQGGPDSVASEIWGRIQLKKMLA